MWRVINDTKFYYTLAKNQKKNQTLARLDLLLATMNMILKIKEIKSKPSANLSDHRPIRFMITSNNRTNGVGFWRFENNLLSDPQFVNECNETIHNTILKYSNIDYNLKELETGDIARLPSKPSPTLILDIVLMKSRETTIKFNARRKGDENLQRTNLEQELNTFPEALSSTL